MSWFKVDNKHEEKYERSFVGEEPYEREYIIDAIKEEFPYFHRVHIEKAFDHSCRLIKAPRNKKDFLLCIADHIGKV